MNRECLICGKEFEPVNWIQKYCSPECSKIGYRNSRKDYYRKNRDKISRYNNRYYSENKERLRDYHHKYYLNHLEEHSQYYKKRYQALKESRNYEDYKKKEKEYKHNYYIRNHYIAPCMKAHNNCFDCPMKNGECRYE